MIDAPSSRTGVPSRNGKVRPFLLVVLFLGIASLVLPFVFQKDVVDVSKKEGEQAKEAPKEGNEKKEEKDLPREKKQEAEAKQPAEVKLLNAYGTRAVTWKAEDAVKFSLDQVVTAINYLFIAAGAGLALVLKFTFEAPSDPNARRFTPFALRLFALAGLFWISSLACGMLAHFRLAELGTKLTFSIHGPAGWFALFQLLYFAVALVLILIALVGTVMAQTE